jgi:hypothetical protein
MDAQDPHDPLDAHDSHDPLDPGVSGASFAAPADGDAVDHLWNAAHEMLSAMRTLLDAADEFVASQRTGKSAARSAPNAPGEGRVQHIDIDADA